MKLQQLNEGYVRINDLIDSTKIVETIRKKMWDLEDKIDEADAREINKSIAIVVRETKRIREKVIEASKVHAKWIANDN